MFSTRVTLWNNEFPLIFHYNIFGTVTHIHSVLVSESVTTDAISLVQRQKINRMLISNINYIGLTESVIAVAEWHFMLKATLNQKGRNFT